MSESVELRVESLAFGGDGVGRIDGKVCFVPFSVPGELVAVRIVENRRNYLRGEIVKVLEESPRRRPPRCSHFGRCGGCQWQHLEYTAQLEAKVRMLGEVMARIGRLQPVVRPIVPSNSEYEYRTRARLRLKGRSIGYLARASADLVEIEECPILAPELERRVKELGANGSGAYAKERRGAAKAGQAVLKLGSGEEVHERLVFPSRSGGGPSDDAYAFHQINRFVNDRLMEAVTEAIDTRLPADTSLSLLDLYCGDGNLSLPLAERAVSVVGYDNAEESIRSAAESARRRRLAHVRYERRDAAEALEVYAGSPPAGSSLCVIADPPRTGLNRLSDRVAALSPDLLIYISCNPPALARDAERLTQAGLRLEYLVPFDMFPQTFHLETVAVFTPPRPTFSRRGRQPSP